MKKLGSCIVKLLLTVAFIIALLFGADKIYRGYSQNYINAHEAIVLINNQLLDEEIDAFFKLEPGTYDPLQHRVLFSLEKNNGYILDYYIDLPYTNVNTFTRKNEFNCDMTYESLRHYGFTNSEIRNKSVIARLVDIKSSARKDLSGDDQIAEKWVKSKIRFGRINILYVHINGCDNYTCE